MAKKSGNVPGYVDSDVLGYYRKRNMTIPSGIEEAVRATKGTTTKKGGMTSRKLNMGRHFHPQKKRGAE